MRDLLPLLPWEGKPVPKAALAATYDNLIDVIGGPIASSYSLYEEEVLDFKGHLAMANVYIAEGNLFQARQEIDAITTALSNAYGQMARIPYPTPEVLVSRSFMEKHLSWFKELAKEWLELAEYKPAKTPPEEMYR